MVRDWSKYEVTYGSRESVYEDIISCLLSFNLDHVVQNIFSYLGSFSLHSALRVSPSWHQFIVEQLMPEPKLEHKWSVKVPSPSYIKCRDTVQCSALSGHLLACGLRNGEVQLWNLLNNTLIGVVMDHRKTAVTAIAFACDEQDAPKLLLSGSWKGEMLVYSLKDKSQLVPVRFTKKLIKSISVHGSIAAVGCLDFTHPQGCDINIVELKQATGGVLRKVLHTGGGLSAVHLGDGRVVAGGGGVDRDTGWIGSWRVLNREDCSRNFFNKEDGTNILNWRCPGGPVSCVLRLHTVESYILAGDTKGNIWIFANGQFITKRRPFTSPIISLKNNRSVVSISSYSGCSIWKLDSLLDSQKEELQKFPSPLPITGVELFTCGLTTSAADGRVLIYDFITNKSYKRVAARVESENDPDIEDILREYESQVSTDTVGNGICPLCGIQDESPNHFFLVCPALARPRIQLLQALEVLLPRLRQMTRENLLEVILYGVEDVQDSKAIRDVVQEFVIRAKT